MAITSRRGIYFSIDALIAVIIILTAMVLMSKYSPPAQQQGQQVILAQDLSGTLSTITVQGSTNTLVRRLVANGTIDSLQYNSSLLDYIAELWSKNETFLASQVLDNITSGIPLGQYSVEYSVGGDNLYTYGSTSGSRSITRTSRLVSGINKSQPVRGFISRMQFSPNLNRTTSSYVYFGGFTGQGNITAIMENLPNDISNSTITNLTMEASAESAFNMLVNGYNCGSYLGSQTGNTSSLYDLMPCESSITPGNNTFEIQFTGALNESYISGGLIKLTYTTTSAPSQDNGIERLFLPDINGVINLYDSIYVPGNLTGMDLHIAYNAIQPINSSTRFFMTIGNKTVYNETNKTSENIYINNITLNSILDFSQMSLKNTPIRIGMQGANYTGTIIEQHPSDTVLVTDTSGSMSECGEYQQPYLCSYYCYPSGTKSCNVASPSDCSGNACGASCWFTFWNSLACSRTKMDIAKKADNISVGIILNSSLTQVGLVSFSSGVQTSYPLTNQSAPLYGNINSYTAGGSTCICCGIYKAVSTLTNQNHDRFIILMTDGDANYKCSGPTDYSGTADSNNGPASTITAGQYACSHNISLYTVSVGSSISSTGINTLKQTACNTSMYYNASNVSALASIYANISRTILQRTYYSSQTVNIIGNIGSHLLGTSYVDLYYEPQSTGIKINEIPIKVQTDQFKSCTPTINIPNNIRLTGARVTSYSGNHWTSFVSANSNTVFNLTNFGTHYNELGDPYIVDIPINYLHDGDNNLNITTADSPKNTTGCSLNDSMLYEGAVAIKPSTSTISSVAAGCNWIVQESNGANFTIAVPSGYSGNATCYYANATYDIQDAYDNAAYNLFRQFDINKDGVIDIYLTGQDLSVDSSVVTNVPSLWGPAEFGITVYK